MKNSFKNIVIVGFPKSGTTWLTRLVADLLQCPIRGNWGFNDPDQPIIEGQEKESDFACYKSHHTYDDIFMASSESIFQIIYIIRDPRDLVVSGTSFFAHDYRLNGIGALKSKIYNQLKGSKNIKEQMIKAVLEGNESLDKWFKIPWQKHYQPYHENKVLFVQYEKLVDQTVAECRSILDHLSRNKSDEEILETISRQSFKVRKNQAIKNKNLFEDHLLREGSHGYWKKDFSHKQKQKFLDNLENDPLFKKLYLG